MAKRRKQTMSFRDAMGLVPDDLPDGAFWAMAHEMAGLDYGDGFVELADDDFDDEPQPTKGQRKHKCDLCGRKLKTRAGVYQHMRDKHGA